MVHVIGRNEKDVSDCDEHAQGICYIMEPKNGVVKVNHKKQKNG